jgi:PAS domain S-box-containing protein
MADQHDQPTKDDPDLEQLRAQDGLRKLNRTLRAMSNSNQAMVRATDETQYLYEVCTIIVKDCGHTMAWVGYARDDADKTVEPIAHAGREQSYLAAAQITWADLPRGRGPVGTAIRTGRVSIFNNMLTDARFGPWESEASQRGFASSIALPLISGGRAFGALAIYSDEPTPFSDEEVQLLSELSADLAHGILSIRLRAAHARTTQALRESEERFRLLSTNSPDILAIQDRDLRYAWAVNPPLGWTLEEMIGKTDRDLLDPEQFERIRALKQQVMDTGQEMHLELPLTNRAGKVSFFEGVYIPRRDAAGIVTGILCYFRDITSRKRTEELLHQANLELEHRVADRTSQLAAANADLRAQMAAYERLEAELARRVEAERVQMGMELHDNLCQQIAAAGMLASSLVKRLRERDPTLAALAERIGGTLTQAGDDAHRMARGLVPVEIEPAGLMMALTVLVRQTQEMQGVTCIFDCAAPVLVENATTAQYLFRIAQEAIHNAIKHGHARHIVVTLTTQPVVSLRVHDDGVGIASAERRAPGSGLQIMAHRARVIGAELRVARAADGGTLVECIVSQGVGLP